MAALVQIMACCRTCNKPLSDPMMVCFTASLSLNVLMLDYGTSITKLQKILQPLIKPLIYTSPDVNKLTEKLWLLLWVLYTVIWCCGNPISQWLCSSQWKLCSDWLQCLWQCHVPEVIQLPWMAWQLMDCWLFEVGASLWHAFRGCLQGPLWLVT